MISLTFILYYAAILSVFYIGYLLGRLKILDPTVPAPCPSANVVYTAPIRPVQSTVEQVVSCPPGMVLESEILTSSSNIAGALVGGRLADAPTTLSEPCHWNSSSVFLHKRDGVTQDLLFNYVNHASQPTRGDIILTHHSPAPPRTPKDQSDVLLGTDAGGNPSCRDVYLTRTGSRESPSPKCGRHCILFTPYACLQ